MKKLSLLLVLVLLCSNAVSYGALIDSHDTTNKGGNGYGGKGGSSKVTNAVTVAGDENPAEKRTHINLEGAAPMATSQGKDEASMGLFGLIRSNSSADVVANNTADFVTKTSGKTLDSEKLLQMAADRLRFANVPTRFLGFAWETSGNNLDTLFGLLSWKSFRKSERK